MPLSVLAGDTRPGDHWTARDRELALALTEIEDAQCKGCGQPQWLAFDPNVSWDVDDDPWRCHPCTAREQAAEEWAKGTPEGSSIPQPSALRWSVTQYKPPVE